MDHSVTTPLRSTYRIALLFSMLATCLCMLLRPALAEDLQPVRVQLKWTHQFQFAGYYAAIEQGYYRDAGFEVSLFERRPGATPIDQLIGGRVDYAVGDSGVMLYRTTGVPVVALAAFFQKSPSVLLTLEESGIDELVDLRGQRVMMQGGYLNAELMSMLQAAGLPSDSFTLLPTDTDIAALIDRRTDAYNAYTTNEPFALSELGISHRIFSPSEYGVDFYGDILITTESQIARDPEGVRRFVEATVKGWRYAVEHPEEVVDLIFREYNTQGRSREHLLFEAHRTIELILPNVVPIGYMNKERWQRIESMFRAQGQLERPIDMADFIYTPDDETDFIEALSNHRLEIAGTLAVLLTLAMVTHILRLRAQVRSRTRELELARERAETEARTDPLTGLPNRRYFFESMVRDVARSEREGTPLALLAIDIDHFKEVNDRHGHAAGDTALIRTAEILGAHVRGSDMAARIGGEEFALACLNAGSSDARHLAERLRAAIEAQVIEHDGQRFSCTVSIGIALREPGDDVSKLMQRADSALYTAKEEGRNRIREHAATRCA